MWIATVQRLLSSKYALARKVTWPDSELSLWPVLTFSGAWHRFCSSVATRSYPGWKYSETTGKHLYSRFSHPPCRRDRTPAWPRSSWSFLLFQYYANLLLLYASQRASLQAPTPLPREGKLELAHRGTARDPRLPQGWCASVHPVLPNCERVIVPRRRLASLY